MKKLLLLLSIVLVSCDTDNNREQVQSNIDEGSDKTFIIELTVRGKTHEYLSRAYGGMVHLPECKYCEKK